MFNYPNQIFTINQNDKYLLRKSPSSNKLILHHLPSMDIVDKYYSQIQYFHINQQLQILVINKNVITFLKPIINTKKDSNHQKINNINNNGLRLIQFQQNYLEWQPQGGLALNKNNMNRLILYNKTTIMFYNRYGSFGGSSSSSSSLKLQKSYQIDFLQQIQSIKCNISEQFIGLKVKQPKNIIFLWNLNNLSKKPNQQITCKQNILQWEFYDQYTLIIMTEKQLKIYLLNKFKIQNIISNEKSKWSNLTKRLQTDYQINPYFAIQYYIPLQYKYKSFSFINEKLNITPINCGRKSVNNILFLKENNEGFHLRELYDIQKRKRQFKYGEIRQIKFEEIRGVIKRDNIFQKLDAFSVDRIISGFLFEQKIIIIVEGNEQKYPKCLTIGLQNNLINNNILKYQIQNITQYKQLHGKKLQNIQCFNNFILFKQKIKEKEEIFKLMKFKEQTNMGENNQYKDKCKDIKQFGPCDKLQLIKTYETSKIDNIFLTMSYIVIINKEKKVNIEKLNQTDTMTNVITQCQFLKFNPQLTYFLYETTNNIFFVSGIRYFKYDIKKNQFINIGFVIKNQKAKLYQVKRETYSMLYKIGEKQQILMQYKVTQLNEPTQKLIFKTIKSLQSQSQRLLSLRNQKWLKLSLLNITYGQKQNQLTTFNLQKMYKTLLQQNVYYNYQVYWTTHNGIVLIIKNYLFFLQIVQNQNGHEIHIIKRQHNYLYRRFSASILGKDENVRLVDPRNIVVYTGNRFVRLANQIDTFITQNPYQIPDTLLNRQLKMREYYPLNHPKLFIMLIENGWFQIIFRLIDKIKIWDEEKKTLKQLYHMINLQDFQIIQKQNNIRQSNIKEGNQFEQEQETDNVIVLNKKQKRIDTDDIQVINKLCEDIINQPQTFHIKQNSPLILQNVLQSLKFKILNSKAMDYFSQSILIHKKILINKPNAFTTWQIAFLMHSINKDQALEFLKNNNDFKIQWNWFQKYSVVLWYDQNVEKLKKWVEQIAMNQFRLKKDPFDCLFWYVLAGKKNLLITLFKAQKFNSKQHDSMHTFLQRDFTDAKNKTAAIKNAYALIDKKRYIHAMSFFLLGQKYEQCIRFSIDRLNDLNLAYLIHLITYNSNNINTISMNNNQNNINNKLPIINLVSKHLIQKGDIWGQHIGWAKQKKHIASFNVLLKENNNLKWQYNPQLKGFHPSVIQFSTKIKQSIPYKRQIQQKKKKQLQLERGNSNNFDYLNFSEDNFVQSQYNEYNQSSKQNNNSSHIQAQNKIKDPQFYTQYEQLFQQVSQDDSFRLKTQLKSKSIKYFIRYHFPILSLAITQTLQQTQSNKQLIYQANRAFLLEKYILTGEINDSCVEIAYGLQDVIGLLNYQILLNQNQKLKNILRHMVKFEKRFENCLKKIKINQLNPPQKHEIGEILYFSYFSERIMKQIIPKIINLKQIQVKKKSLIKLNNLGKIIAGISLKIWSNMSIHIQAYVNSKFIQSDQQFWFLLRSRYDFLIQKKKQKHQKLMDCFQLSLNKHIKKQKDQKHFGDFNIKLVKESTLNVIVFQKIFQFLEKQKEELENDEGIEMKFMLKGLKTRLEKIINYWTENQHKEEIYNQIFMLVKQGLEIKLKLNFLSQLFCQKDKEQPNYSQYHSQSSSLQQFYHVLKLIFTPKDIKQYQQKSSRSLKNEDKSQLLSQIEAIQIFRNKIDGLKSFTLNKNQGKGLQMVILSKKGIKNVQILDSLLNRDRNKEGNWLIHQDNLIGSNNKMKNQNLGINYDEILSKNTHPKVMKSIINIINSRKIYDKEETIIKNTKKQSQHLIQYLKTLDPLPNLDFNEINSIQSHSYLPIFFLGGKGVIQVCRFDINKNFNRITCLGMQNIIKIKSIAQRIYVLDSAGSFAGYVFDHKYNNKSIFELKKQSIIGFDCLTPSIICYYTVSTVYIIDTLLHPKKQIIWKLNISNNPVISIKSLNQHQIVILRKNNQVQIYNIKIDKLEQSYPINKGKYLLTDLQNNKILIGQKDCKIKIINLNSSHNTSDANKTIQKIVKVGSVQDDKDKIFIEKIQKFRNSYICYRNDGSMYCFNDQ